MWSSLRSFMWSCGKYRNEDLAISRFFTAFAPLLHRFCVAIVGFPGLCGNGRESSRTLPNVAPYHWATPRGIRKETLSGRTYYYSRTGEKSQEGREENGHGAKKTRIGAGVHVPRRFLRRRAAVPCGRGVGERAPRGGGTGG